LRKVGTSGPPRGAPMTTGVVVGLSTVVVTRTSQCLLRVVPRDLRLDLETLRSPS